ncbi:MAG: AmmeMemoRadiSam system protein B [Ectothiorhodospiraceae bacterium]|nr:AmmeMemoRadiSam system protein B [Ectothiorhodospiraceae bacterium]
MNHTHSLQAREPAVAGTFYPDDARQLHDAIVDYLHSASVAEAAEAVSLPVHSATRSTSKVSNPKAIIAPHAGYIYSGPVAASIYTRLLPVREQVKRVVILGPSHRVAFSGLATSSADVFTTPLGDISLDRAALDSLLDLPQVHCRDEAHRLEHSVEVHLPFLQEIFQDFQLLPLVVGDASPPEVAEVLARLWGGPETLIVISSDLSHFHDYNTAQRMDPHTSDAIENLQAEAVHSEDACGCVPVSGLLYLARERQLQVETLDLRNSGDTAGPRDRVVGYGAYAFH